MEEDDLYLTPYQIIILVFYCLLLGAFIYLR